MSKSTPHIISIWLVDPVGGTFVDWPANVEDADFGPESLVACLFGPSAIRPLALPILNTLTALCKQTDRDLESACLHYSQVLAASPFFPFPFEKANVSEIQKNLGL